MGKNNRQRRAAKQKKRATRGAGHEQQRRAATARDVGSGLPPIGPEEVLVAAMTAVDDPDRGLLDRFVDRAMSFPAVADAAQHLVEETVAALWTGGWQPADLARAVRRGLGECETGIVRWALAASFEPYEALGRRVAPEWVEQLDAAGAVRSWDLSRPYLQQVDADWREVVLGSVRLLHLLDRLPPLPVLTPPPHQWHEGMAVAAPSNLPPGLLDKVRGLLSKAEATTFDAEAEAFTAKAQELMARHRIDRAVLAAASSDQTSDVRGRRISIDDPYADARAALLGTISSANGGHAIWSKQLGFSTVFGHSDDLDAIEELFTSLLVQATAALRRQGSKHDREGRSRTTRFRRSFLVAFAQRIGERLRAAVDDTVAAADTGGLLPILAASDAEVRDAADRAFPESSSFRPSATDGEGWHAGRLFADQADVGLGAPLEERAAS